MHRATRYAVALLVAGIVTGGVATAYRDAVLLLGIFAVYAVTTPVLLRYPALLRGTDADDKIPSALFAGGSAFGVLSLAQGLGIDFHVGAAVLGYGLTVFGLAMGVWLARDASR